MKEIVALLFVMCAFTVGLYLTATRSLDWRSLTVWLAFSVVVGFLVVNHANIRKMKLGGTELETFQRDVAEVRDSAITEIREEVTRQRQSVDLAVAAANELRNQIEIQKVEVAQLLDRTEVAESELSTHRSELETIASTTKVSAERIANLNSASDELALLLVRMTWLQAQTRGEFGGSRAHLAYEQIGEDLNRIIQMVIPDQTARDQWIDGLNASLSPRGGGKE
jgi:hypothetical protein